MQRYKRSAFLAAVFSAIVAGPPAQALNPNAKLCFRQFTGVPFNNVPPAIDGKIDGDVGWTNSFGYTFNTGTPLNDGDVRGIKDNNNLYLSFEVRNDPTFDNEDVIVIALDLSPGGAANQHLIHIYPVFAAGVGAEVSPGTGARPRLINYFFNNFTGNATANPPWLFTDNVRVSGAAAGGSVQYFVEVKIPFAQIAVPVAGNFGLYFNVVRVDSSGGSIEPIAGQTWWPEDAPLTTGEVEDGTPPANDWGTATLAGVGSCNGVSFTWSDISTNQANPGLIALNAANLFRVSPKNSLIDNNGAFIAANNVRATFKIANFGLPAPQSWQPVPSGASLSNIANIPAQVGAVPGTVTLESQNAWTLTPAEQATYNTNATRHQCVMAELNSTAANVVFINRSTWRNMNFGNASVLTRNAQIGTAGYKTPEGGNHRFDLHVFTREERYRGREGAGAVAQTGGGSRLTFAALGRRHTSDFIIIEKKKFRIVQHVGGFGYFIDHPAGPDVKVGWKHEIRGAQRLGNRNVYRADVAHGKVGDITTVIQASDAGGGPGGKTCFARQAMNWKPVVFAFILAGLFAYLPRRRP